MKRLNMSKQDIMEKELSVKEEAYAIKEKTKEPFPECLGSELQYCGDCRCAYSNVCFKRILEKRYKER